MAGKIYSFSFILDPLLTKNILSFFGEIQCSKIFYFSQNILFFTKMFENLFLFFSENYIFLPFLPKIYQNSAKYGLFRAFLCQNTAKMAPFSVESGAKWGHRPYFTGNMGPKAGKSGHFTEMRCKMGP